MIWIRNPCKTSTKRYATQQVIKHHYHHCHDHQCPHRCHDDCRRTSFVARSAKQSIGSWELCRRHQQVCNFVLILLLTLILIVIFILTLILKIEIQSESGDISRNYLLSSQLTQKIWTQQPNTLKGSFRQIAKTMFQALFEWIFYSTSLIFV